MRRKLGIQFGLAMLLLLPAACSSAPIVQPTAIVTRTDEPSPTVASTATVLPSATAEPTATSTPTLTVAPSPTSTRTATRTATPKPTLTRTPSPIPSPTQIPGPAQICADLAAQGLRDLRILYIHPEPELVWDRVPRQFHVGVCDTFPAPNTPQGKYFIAMTFPDGNRGGVHSDRSTATLNFGLNDVLVGPWIPGLENHAAICATRAIGETQVMYSDNPDNIFRPLLWENGADTVGLPIKCGGDYS